MKQALNCLKVMQMKRQTRADVGMTAATLFLGASLVFSGSAVLRLRWSGAGASPALNLAELLGAAAAGAGIGLLGWWLLALVCACISGAAQSLGAVRLAAFAEAWSPAFMRRVVTAVMGLNLLAAPLAGAAEGPGVDPRWHADTVATAPAVVAPNESGGTPSLPAGPGGAVQDVLPAAPSAPVEPQWIPHAPDIDPDLVVRPSTRPGPSPTAAGGGSGVTASDHPAETAPGGSGATEVVVKNGDSLWSIVAAALGPYSSDVDVALAWPGWYKANRETIGANPDVIFPGQILHAPAGQ